MKKNAMSTRVNSVFALFLLLVTLPAQSSKPFHLSKKECCKLRKNSLTVPATDTARGASTAFDSTVLPVAEGVHCVSILSAFESVNAKANLPIGSDNTPTSARMVGIPDGLGAFDNQDGTFTLLMNHELTGGVLVSANGDLLYDSTTGIRRRHHLAQNIPNGRQFGGAFVSRWVINKKDLTVHSIDDLCSTMMVWNRGTPLTPQFLNYRIADPYVTYGETFGAVLSEGSFERLCSADLPAPTALFNSLSGKGTHTRIFFSGEESTAASGRAFAHCINGKNASYSYELAALGRQSFENILCCPFEQDITIAMAQSDGPVGGRQVTAFVGNKKVQTSQMLDVEAAGFLDGILYGVTIPADGVKPAVTTESNVTNIGLTKGGSRIFGLAAVPDQKFNATAPINLTVAPPPVTMLSMTQNALNAVQACNFLRPEDGAWDPSNPSNYYFVVTDTNAFTASGKSRLYRLHFSDITHPENGGQITLLLDGTEGQSQMDNITIDKTGHILIQEDPGITNPFINIWQYTIATGDFHIIARVNPAIRDANSPEFITRDIETSGIVDASDILGAGWFLLDVQIHRGTWVQPPFSTTLALDYIRTYGPQVAREVAELGQLVALYNPDSNPCNKCFAKSSKHVTESNLVTE